ncbi:unnamed protein product [Rhodiola kirilowii]
MPLSLISSAPVIRYQRRRLPAFGTLCALTFGFSSITFLYSSSSFTSTRSQPLRKPLGSTRTIAMAGSGNTVPSIVVYVTVPNKELGKKLAESIVKEKLAACVNRVPGVESVYQWKGEIQTDSEELLIIKTRESLLEALTEHVKANHEYEVPEVIALPITGGSIPYLEWIKSNTRD